LACICFAGTPTDKLHGELMKHLIPILLLVAACQKNESKPHSDDLGELQLFYDMIHKEVVDELNPETGWPSIQDCDALLFSGIACTLDFPVRINLAEYSPGEIHRRPSPSCYTKEHGDQGSKSTISRDMLTAYIACLFHLKDLDALKRLADYGEDNAWIMGEPRELVSRVYLGSNLTSILGRAIYSLSNGDSDREYRHLTPIYLSVSQDYERHLQVQAILLYEKISGSITDNMLEILKENLYNSINDPLFMAAVGKFTGDQKQTIDLLMGKTMCPSYARGKRPDLYCKILWLQASKIVLDGAR